MENLDLSKFKLSAPKCKTEALVLLDQSLELAEYLKKLTAQWVDETSTQEA